MATVPAAAQSLDLLTLPGSGTVSQTSPQTYALPGYGNVTVSWVAHSGSTVPSASAASFAMLNGITIPGAGTLPANVRMLALDPNPTARAYDLKLTFLSGQPDLTRLKLLVFNLGVWVGSPSNTSRTTLKPTPMVLLAGQLGVTGATATQAITGGAIQSTSNANSNTGVAAYTTGSLPTDNNGNTFLLLDTNQIFNDQISLTLAYTHQDPPPPPSGTGACCPPLTTDMTMLRDSFSWDQMPGEPIAGHYGMIYNVPPAFDTQMQLWAPYAANALATPGWHAGAVFMVGDLRTDGPAPGLGPVVSAIPATQADYNAAYSVIQVALRVWWSNGMIWPNPAALADSSLPKPAGSDAHMQATTDRRYMLGVSYWLLETNNTTGEQHLLWLCDGGGILSWHRNLGMMNRVGGGDEKARRILKQMPLDFATVRARLGNPKTMKLAPSMPTSPGKAPAGQRPAAAPTAEEQQAAKKSGK